MSATRCKDDTVQNTEQGIASLLGMNDEQTSRTNAFSFADNRIK
jgi:hypothetical protein